MHTLFKEIASPIRNTSSLKEANYKWFTWSEEFREEIPRLKQQLKRLKSIDFIYLKKYKDYNYTYQVNISKLDADFIEIFTEYTRSLLKFNPRKKIYFFTKLIDKDINGRLYHFIIALFRTVIVQITKKETSALYSPLTAGKNESGFPLHCDLYIPKILFNVLRRFLITVLDLQFLFKRIFCLRRLYH